jgi:phospholipase C
MTASPSAKFDHLVVLMFENRSFDNLLGYLYRPGETRSFEGLHGRDLSNPIPPGLQGSERLTVPVHPVPSLDTPDPDPGEEHPHTNTQLYGIVDPPENRFKHVKEMQAPYNAPPSMDTEPTMEGFVADYVNSFREQIGRLPTYDEYSQIMACFTPDRVPVVAALAKGFACFDHWFCEVPTQTFANRSFFHAASSSGFVLNEPIHNFVVGNEAPTIFERLEEAKLPWKVYSDPEMIVSITGLIHARRLAPYFPTHFSTIFDFYADAARGTLPAYSFIEPNLLHPHTDMHPPMFDHLRRILPLPAPAAIRGGELLLDRVYNAVKTSSNPTGSNFANTLLVVTFDEHGGTYDHVPPPRVPAPSPGAPAGQEGFTFERSGVRIPTLVISAWVDPGTVVNREFRSTSVIRTLRERWSLGAPLTQRDAIAADLSTILTRDTPRPADSWPEVAAIPLGPMTRMMNAVYKPITSMGKQIFAAAIAHEVRATGSPYDVDIATVSHRKAQRHMRKLRAATFPGVQNGRQG